MSQPPPRYRPILTLMAALFVTALAVYVTLPLVGPVLGVVLTLLLAILLTLLLLPLVDRLEARGVKRTLAVLGIYLGILLFALLLGGVFTSALVGNMYSLAQNSAEFSQNVATALERLPAVGPSLSTLGMASGLTANQVAGGITTVVNNIIAGLERIGGSLFNVSLVFLLAFFLLTDKPFIYNALHTFVPAAHHARADAVLERASSGLSRWFLAQALISLYYVVTYSVTNMIMGIPYALPIGVIAGLLEFIPYLGGTVGLILTALAALTVSPLTVIYVLVWDTIIGTVGSNVIGPYVYSRAVHISPFVVLTALLLGASVGGFLGALLTMPLVVVTVVLVREWRQRADGDEAEVSSPDVNSTAAEPLGRLE